MSLPKIHLTIRAEGQRLSSASLSLAPSFSYEILGADAHLQETIAAWLRSYLKAENRELNGDLFPPIASPFQRNVLLEMSRIPFGSTVSYRELGEKCNISSARAIGGACSRNPLPFLIPCHRVIRSDGSLGGFSPDIEIKKRLLAFEQPSKFTE